MEACILYDIEKLKIMRERSIYFKVKIILYRLFLKTYFICSNAMLPPSDRGDLWKLQNYIYNNINFSLSSGIVIYAATIGELRAASSLIHSLQERFPGAHLILIPGQTQYISVFAKIYPVAIVMKEFPLLPSLADQFFKNIQIKFCMIIEGPSLHGFFPIRQDLSLSASCLQHNVPMFVANACLYEKTISSRFDLIEHKFFADILQEAIVRLYVPNHEIENAFLKHGVPQQKLLVAGDIKLDNAFSEPLPPISNDLNEVFQFFQKQCCRLIVAGSVNDYDEQIALVHAWSILRQSIPNIVLVLVPRYVNNNVMMNKLYQYLTDKEIQFARRSQGMNDLDTHKLLVVDVFGELPYFYEYAEIAFAGRGHGVLEPMKYSKPVVVGPHQYWTKESSTAYLLYQQMRDNHALIECSSYADLGEIFLNILEDRQFGEIYVQRYTQTIKQKMGASEKIIEHMIKLLNLQPGPNQVVKPDNAAKAAEIINHR